MEAHRRAEATRVTAGNRAHAATWEVHDVRLALGQARQRLAEADPAYAAELDAAHRAAAPSREEIEEMQRLQNEAMSIRRLEDASFIPYRDTKDLHELQRTAGPSREIRPVGRVGPTHEPDEE